VGVQNSDLGDDLHVCVSAAPVSGRLAGMVWSLLYGLARNVLGMMALRVRGDSAKEVEILALRHQLAVLRRQADRPRLEPADRGSSRRCPDWCPRGRWGSFLVTPATVLPWHRELQKQSRLNKERCQRISPEGSSP
jgi:hypothetical protein